MGLAAAHLVLKASALPGLPCPARELIGATCPGCGLGSALTCLTHFEWHQAWGHHAFAPLFAAGLLVLVAINLLPARARHTAVSHVAAFEERVAVGPIFTGALLVYWLLRLR